ncbi:MAG: FAD-dependent oxidoreductase [Deltaproteobacteria bacterium]|nr:FAD-dependent oxidoreductase [Deltaproteobacteria bacterium]
MKRTGRVLVCTVTLVMIWLSIGIAAVEEHHNDVVVVGTGVSGLAAIWELARSNIDVAVIEMSSHYGGTALMSEGRICIIGTPEQAHAGMPDSPQIAFEDFTAFGRDERGSGPHAEWVHYYVTESRREIYDWLTGLGVRFEKDVGLMPGNRVPRWHQVIGKGRGLIEPIYRECAHTGNVTFFWSTRAVSLLRDGDRIRGVRAERLGDHAKIDYLAPVVILATGGFQSNMDMVRENWPTDLPFPDRLLIGAGLNAVGSGHEMAQAAGAQLKNMSNQWNYATGLPDPLNPAGQRGLNTFSPQSIWVNKAGRRFVSESQDTKTTFPAVLRQPGSTYWAVFDSAARGTFFVSGWDRQTIESTIFDNPAMTLFVKSAPTVRELAEAAGLPPDAIENTVRRWNEMVTAGRDDDFGRIGSGQSSWSHPSRIERPPFYAVQFFPLTRKSMGGVAIDMSCRVTDSSGRPIPGLYAVGELTGLAGINGKASLEGTFLGPSIVTGRVAGRAVAAELTARKKN